VSIKRSAGIWKETLSSGNFKWYFIATVIFSLVLAYFAPRVLEWNEFRKGFSFDDPLLTTFSPVDLTWFTFIALYGGVFITFHYFSDKPVRFMMGFQAYFFLLSSRLIAMTFLPLKAPETLIPLYDPFISSLSSGIVLKHDLFFSGHFSVAVLLSFVVADKVRKYILLFLAGIMAVFILLQHVHYTIDIFVAPFFSFAIWRMIVAFNKKIGFTPEV